MMKIVVEILFALILSLGLSCDADEAMLLKEYEESQEQYLVTAYCSCEICCGKWALNRPNGIVYTSNGSIAEEGVTIAADWNVLSPGTIVYIDGLGLRTVQDEGSAIIGKHIDVYMDEHQKAAEFGAQYLNLIVLYRGEVKE